MKDLYPHLLDFGTSTSPKIPTSISSTFPRLPPTRDAPAALPGSGPTDASRGHTPGAVDGAAAVVEVFPEPDDAVVNLGGGAQTELHQRAEVFSG